MTPSSINKNVAFTSISRFFFLVFTFIYAVLMVRLLGAEGNGVFSFLIVNAQIATMFLGLNTGSGLVYYLAKGNFPKEQIIGFVGFIFSIASVLILIISSALFFAEPHTLKFLLPIGYQNLFFLLFFLLSFLAQVFIQFCTGFAFGNLYYKIYNQYVFFSSLVKVLLISLFYVGVQINLIESKLEYVFILFLSIELLFSVIFLFFLSRRQPIRMSFHFPYQSFVKPFLIYSIKGWLVSLLKFFTSRFFNWIVAFYHGLKSLGFMALAVSLYTNAEMFFSPIHQALNPYLIKLPIEEGKERFLFFLRLTNTVAILMALGVYFLSPFFIPLIFGKEFEASIVVTQIIFLSMPFISLRGMGTTYATSQNRHQFIVIAETISFIIAIVADLIFIPQYGIQAAAWVMLIAFGISGCLISFFMITQMHVPIHRNLLITSKDFSYIWQLLKGKIRQFLN